MIYSRRIHAIYTYDSSRMDLLEYTVEMWRIAWLCIGGEKNAVCWCNAVHFGQLRRIRGLSYDLKNLQRNHHSMKSHRAYETMIYKIRNWCDKACIDGTQEARSDSASCAWYILLSENQGRSEEHTSELQSLG